MGYTYVVSDIHGDYDKYRQIFKTIDFKDDDILYLLGDIVDRGNGSCKIILDAMYRTNVYLIMGNHELIARQCLRDLSKEITEETIKEVLPFDNYNQIVEWMAEGGNSTVSEFRELSLENREAVLDYLDDDWEYYKELHINGHDFILVHASLNHFEENKPIYEYSSEDLLFNRMDYSKVYFKDKFIVSGHTPTSEIKDNPHPNKIYIQNNHIAIDCGCGYGHNLGIIRLEDLKEFYVE